MRSDRDLPVALYATCPPAPASPESAYASDVARVARWSEEAGCTGILVYTDNSLPDPWLVAQVVVASTRSLRPLVAIQPAYMHPFAAATMVSTLAHLHGRAVDLNLVSGGFRNDLVALGDATPHDQRYERLIEYTTIMMRLLRGEAVTFRGAFYEVAGLRLAPPLPESLVPELFVAGSSAAGMGAALALGAVAVKYPRPAAEEQDFGSHPGRKAIRVAVVARETEAEAWRAAAERYPGNRKGELLRQLASKVSDSQWHRQLAEAADAPQSPYWLAPFQSYSTNCPCLVGSYDRVAEELSRYVSLGAEAVIVDVPRDEEELSHARTALAMSALGVAS